MFVRLMNGVTVELPEEMAEKLIEAGKATRSHLAVETRNDDPPTSNGGRTRRGRQPATEPKPQR